MPRFGPIVGTETLKRGKQQTDFKMKKPDHTGSRVSRSGLTQGFRPRLQDAERVARGHRADDGGRLAVVPHARRED